MKEELLSALMDGESSPLESRQAMNSLRDDTSLRSQFERYQAVRAVLQGTYPTALTKGFADRVMAEVESTPLQTPAQSGKTWIQYALAASLSGIAMFGWWQYRSQGTDAIVATTENSAPSQSLADQDVVPAANAPTFELSPEDGALLNSYLVNHSEHSAPSTLPYVQLVGFSAAQR